MIVEALIFVASTCSDPNVEECYIIPHPTNEHKMVLEVCETRRGEPIIEMFYTNGVPRLEIKTIHKPVVMCSSRNRPKDHLHWMQVQ